MCVCVEGMLVKKIASGSFKLAKKVKPKKVAKPKAKKPTAKKAKKPAAKKIACQLFCFYWGGGQLQQFNSNTTLWLYPDIIFGHLDIRFILVTH